MLVMTMVNNLYQKDVGLLSKMTVKTEKQTLIQNYIMTLWRQTNFSTKNKNAIINLFMKEEKRINHLKSLRLFT